MRRSKRVAARHVLAHQVGNGIEHEHRAQRREHLRRGEMDLLAASVAGMRESTCVASSDSARNLTVGFDARFGCPTWRSMSRES